MLETHGEPDGVLVDIFNLLQEIPAVLPMVHLTQLSENNEYFNFQLFYIY